MYFECQESYVFVGKKNTYQSQSMTTSSGSRTRKMWKSRGDFLLHGMCNLTRRISGLTRIDSALCSKVQRFMCTKCVVRNVSDDVVT